jgi:uncharacterized protein (TIGR03437 family)
MLPIALSAFASMQYGDGQIALPVPWAQQLYVGDFNGDGKPDVLVAENGPGTNVDVIYVYLGKGDGTFSAPIETPDLSDSGAAGVADFNGDGKLDLVVYTSGTEMSYIALGNGDGTFNTGANALIGVGGWVNAIADFNGDGKPDLLVSQGGSHGPGPCCSSAIAILFNNGDGTFTRKSLSVGSTPVSLALPAMAIGDVNLDNKADIVTTAGVLLSNGDGSFQSVPWSDPDEGLGFTGGFGAAIADLNGDGKPDIIYVSSLNAGYAYASPPSVVVLFGNGDGTFRIGDFYVLGGAGIYQSLVVADFDLDGAPDVAVSSAPTSPGEAVAGLTILQNYGDGTLRNTISVNGLSLGSNVPLLLGSLNVADFNGDGKPDLALIDAPAAVATGPNASTMAAVLLNGAPLEFPVLLGGIVNAASCAHIPLSPGSLASAYTLLQPYAPEQAGVLPLPTSQDGVTLWINNERVPILAVSPSQVNFQVPWDLASAGSAVPFSFETPAQNYASNWDIGLATFSPGIFTMNGDPSGQAAAIIANTSVIAAPTGAFAGARPVAAGEFISIYCTGLGPVTNQPASGAAALASPLSTTQSVPIVTVGGVQAAVQFSGLAPGMVGVNQVNVQIPQNAPTGPQVPLEIETPDGSASNPATIAVQ